MHIPLWARWALPIPTFTLTPSPTPGTFAPQITNGATCYVDPSDAHYLQLPWAITAGRDTVRVDASATYSGIAPAATALQNGGLQITPGATTTYGFNQQLQYSSIPNGQVVTQTLSVYDPYYPGKETTVTATATFTLYRSPTLIPTSTTTVVVTTVPFSTKSTSTSTVTAYNTAYATPVVNVVSTTGVSTVYAPTPVTTTTSTITPTPRTVGRAVFSLKRTTLWCLGLSKRDLDEQAEAAELVARGGGPIGDSNYMAPSCGSYNPTTLYTTTNVGYSTVYTTDITTVLATTTLPTTVTAPTSTNYLSVVGTTTVTPSPSTATRYNIVPQSTVTQTRTLLLVQTVLPSGRRTPRCVGGDAPAGGDAPTG